MRRDEVAFEAPKPELKANLPPDTKAADPVSVLPSRGRWRAPSILVLRPARSRTGPPRAKPSSDSQSRGTWFIADACMPTSKVSTKVSTGSALSSASDDEPQGTLTSVPFKVTHPRAAFLVGGGSGPATCVELIRKDTGEVISRTSGFNAEAMRRIAVDLHPVLGAEIFVRLVDKDSRGWGHINFDDFRFHARAGE